MYALIYDTHQLDHPQKQVVSMHRTRANAEKALDARKRRLGKTVEECDTRIVWLRRKASVGDTVTVADFSTWKPGEPVPYGETHPDSD